MKGKIAKISDKSKYNKKDLQVLYILNQDCRLSSRQIGRITHTSAEMAEYRVKKLIRTGAIRSFHTTISLARLGFQSYTLLLQLERASLEDEKKLIGFLAKLNVVRHVQRCRGNWDINVSFVCKDRLALSRFIDRVHSFSGIIGSDFLLIPIKPLKFDDLRFISQVSFESSEPKITLDVSIDELDEKILLILAENAKLSIRKLSREIALSPDATYDRFKKLLAMGLMRRFRATLNYEVFGLQEYELFLKIDAYDQKEEIEIRNFLKERKLVMRATRIVGNYDIWISVLCKNLQEFETELEKIRSFFGKRVRMYLFSLVVKDYKRTSCPDIFSKEKKED